LFKVAVLSPVLWARPWCLQWCHQTVRFLHRQCAICIEDSYPAGGIKPKDVGPCATEGAVRAALRARAEKYPRQDSNL
jgi:hypothetical protein